jgi:PAS domain-containing protein
MDSFARIQDHLGAVLLRLSALEGRAAGGADLSRQVGRCLTDLQQVVHEVDQAFAALKDERGRLQTMAGEAEATMALARKLFVESPNACVVLNRDAAAITDANTAASRLLNVSRRFLIGKSFTHFLQQDRDGFLRQLRRSGEPAADQWTVALRPRERAMVRVMVTPIADHGDEAAILLSPETVASLVQDGTSGQVQC